MLLIFTSLLSSDGKQFHPLIIKYYSNYTINLLQQLRSKIPPIDIKKMNLSHETVEHKKTRTYDVGNTCPDWGQTHKCGGV